MFFQRADSAYACCCGAYLLFQVPLLFCSSSCCSEVFLLLARVPTSSTRVCDLQLGCTMVLHKLKPKKDDVTKQTAAIKRSNSKLKKSQSAPKSDRQVSQRTLTIGRSLCKSGLCDAARAQVWCWENNILFFQVCV